MRNIFLASSFPIFSYFTLGLFDFEILISSINRISTLFSQIFTLCKLEQERSFFGEIVIRNELPAFIF